MSKPERVRDDRVAAMQQEHEELVQLFVHEDSMAWQLNFAFLAANAGLFAAVETLGVFDIQKKVGVSLVAVLITGVFVNLVGFFVMQRSKIHRLSRLYRAYRVEKELADLEVPIKTFESAEGTIHKGEMLNPIGEQSDTRKLRKWERVEALNLRIVFNVLAAAFLVLSIWAFAGRPWLQ